MLPTLIGFGMASDGVIVTQGHADREAIVQERHRDWFHFDALHYARIVDTGYTYSPTRKSPVAFFPAYPLTARALSAITGWGTRISLLVVAHGALIGFVCGFSHYLRLHDVSNYDDRVLALTLIGVVPTGFFFRMPYSESTFLLVTVLAMIAIQRRSPSWICAFLAGTATAVRPVGVAVSAAFFWYLLSEQRPGSITRRAICAISYLPIACWGLLAFMAYQYTAFDAPLGFAYTQDNWRELRGGPRGTWDKIESLVSLEPIWGVFTSDAERTWMRPRSSDNPLFNFFFWNPIFFVATGILIGIGAKFRWLTGPEIVLSALLLAIPYWTRAYEMCMSSQARFAAVVFPAFIVLSKLLGLAPSWVTWIAISTLAMLQMIWVSLYAAGYFSFY